MSKVKSSTKKHRQHDGGSAHSFAAEVTRVAREVGTEGSSADKQSAKASPGRGKDLTDNVNSWQQISPGQVRNIAESGDSGRQW